MPGILRLIALYLTGGFSDRKQIIGSFHLPPIIFKACRKGQGGKYTGLSNSLILKPFSRYCP
jgi:hypothetical protein